jgi:molybdate transport system substrate-binding protein
LPASLSLRAVAALLLGWLTLATASAQDVVAYCDPTLAHVLRGAGAMFERESGASVYVFSAPPSLMLAQIAHHVQNDVLVTGTSWMDQAEQGQLIQPDSRVGAWQVRLVIARRVGTAPSNDAFAITDATPGSTIDGPAVLAALGLKPAHLLGGVDVRDVAFFLETGAASQGILYQTDVAADPRLEVVRPIGADVAPPTRYVAAINRMSHNPNARRFLDFLTTPQATTLLRAGGLEPVP